MFGSPSVWPTMRRAERAAALIAAKLLEVTGEPASEACREPGERYCRGSSITGGYVIRIGIADVVGIV